MSKLRRRKLVDVTLCSYHWTERYYCGILFVLIIESIFAGAPSLSKPTDMPRSRGLVYPVFLSQIQIKIQWMRFLIFFFGFYRLGYGLSMIWRCNETGIFPGIQLKSKWNHKFYFQLIAIQGFSQYISTTHCTNSFCRMTTVLLFQHQLTIFQIFMHWIRAR